VDVRIPVQAGDLLGFFVPSAYECGTSGPAMPDALAVAFGATDPADGTTTGATEQTGGRIAIAAMLEPDVNANGYGDDTQDIDLGLSAVASPSAITVGDVAVIGMTVSNDGLAGAPATTVAATLPSGLQYVSARPLSCAFSTSLSCPFGTLAGGSSREMWMSVKGVAAGPQTVQGTASASAGDINPANNGASTTLTVKDPPTPPAAAPPGPVQAASAPSCKVPSLSGLTTELARRVATAAGCKVGKLSRKKVRTGKTGRVVAQKPAAGTSVPTGTAIDVTLGTRAKHR
jgi:uncharacterized repeat protein (TIGR01451 family)